MSRLYKPERKRKLGSKLLDVRKRGVLKLEDQAPVGCPDANHYEIAMALSSLCAAGGITVGRGGSYDAVKDEYTVIGTIAGKAQDLKIEGVAVAALIWQLRDWNGVKQFDKQGLTKALGA